MSGMPSRRRFLKSTTAAMAAGWLATDIHAARCEEPAADGKQLQAGAAAVDITPEHFPVIVNGGVSEGLATEVVDRLHARALVLDDGTTRLAIAVVDSCVIPRALLDKAKELARASTGIPVDRMLISATHTHSAPAVAAALGSDIQADYAEWLPGRIARAIELANANLAPARIGWGVGQDPNNVFCRRYLMKPGTALTNRFGGTKDDQAQMNPGYLNPNAIERTGPVDTDVSVLSVQTPDGRPLALLANYSTHYAGSPAISADYFGVFCEKIGQLIGAEGGTPAFVGLMSNGTSGDANCCDFDHAARKFDRFTVAEDVARAAYEAYRKIRYYDWAPLVMRQRLLTLGVRMPSPEEVAEAKEFLPTFEGRKPRNWTEVYARETVLLDQMPPTRELKLQAIRIGELGITGIPAEVYGITGLGIKQKSPLRPTFNIELANGWDGYIPTPRQFELGGYTTWRARSSCLEVGAEPKIKAAVLELLGQVADARRDEPPRPAG